MSLLPQDGLLLDHPEAYCTGMVYSLTDEQDVDTVDLVKVQEAFESICKQKLRSCYTQYWTRSHILVSLSSQKDCLLRLGAPGIGTSLTKCHTEAVQHCQGQPLVWPTSCLQLVASLHCDPNSHAILTSVFALMDTD